MSPCKFSCCLLAFLLFHAFGLFAQSVTTANIPKIDSLALLLAQREQFNGAVLLAQKGKVLLEQYQGQADVSGLKKLNASSSFNLASVSKQFTAAAIVLLAEAGKLRFDDPIDKYLPGLPYDGVTIRHLLTHTSGIPEYFELADRFYPLNHIITNADLITLYQLRRPNFDFQPGERWEYSNTNYVFLASIAEKVSGEPLGAFLQKRIFKPIGMADTYVFHQLMSDWPGSRVYGFYKQGGQVFPNDLTHFDGLVGDGNVYSSARDLLRWAQALTSGKVFKPASLQASWTPVKLNDGSTYPYGFGWFLPADGREATHTGGWAGFRTLIHLKPSSGEVLVVLTNGTNGGIAVNAFDKTFSGQTIAEPQYTLIHNVNIIDGSGAPAFKGAVRLRNQTIADVGNLKPWPNETVIDGMGMTLAPGFIDTHSHHSSDYETDDAVVAAISQGITTIIVGQDGGSHLPLADFFARVEKEPATVNLASYCGHNTLRFAVMGNQDFKRIATPAEVDSMEALLQRELNAGALGLSTGLEYDPGIFSNQEEVMTLAKVASAAGGRYISHIRSEDIDLEAAVAELVQIGREAKLPVQISHFKVGMKGKWGSSRQLISTLQQARNEGIQVSADVYPYEYWMSTLEVLFPKRDFDNRASAEFALRELASPEGMLIAEYEAQPELVGKTIAEIAKQRGEDPATTYMWLIAEARARNADEMVIGTAMTESDIIQLLSWPHSNVCSDGAGYGLHPRGYGAFPRVLSRYVRELNAFSLETAVQKMTSLAAEHTGISDRGLIAPGFFADLVLFDPATVRDKSTTSEPHAIAEGIHKVWVNGEVVYNNGHATDKRPGKVLRRQQAPAAP